MKVGTWGRLVALLAAGGAAVALALAAPGAAYAEPKGDGGSGTMGDTVIRYGTLQIDSLEWVVRYHDDDGIQWTDCAYVDPVDGMLSSYGNCPSL